MTDANETETSDADVARHDFDALPHALTSGVPGLGKTVASGLAEAGQASTAGKSKHVHSGFAHERPVNESVEWYTPKEIFDAIGLTFDLDPCSPGDGKSFVPALRHLTIVDDGLATPWEGTVFMNPPYGPHTKTWMAKLAEHGDGIALIFARTDTKWFHDSVAPRADLVCFISTRVKFYKGGIDVRGDSPGAGSMLVAYGEKSAQALLDSGLGACMRFVRDTPADAADTTP